MNELNKLVRTMTAAERSRKVRIVTFMFLAFAVAVMVCIILIRPAESKSGNVTCELQEHVHTDECYGYICGFSDFSEDEYGSGEMNGYDEDGSEDGYTAEKFSSHVHTDECRVLVCGLPEHTHSESCFNPTGDKCDDDLNQGDSTNESLTVENLSSEISDSENENADASDDSEDEMAEDMELTDEEDLNTENMTEEEYEKFRFLKFRSGLSMFNLLTERELFTPAAGNTRYKIRCKLYENTYVGLLETGGTLVNGAKLSGNAVDGLEFVLQDAGDGYYYIKPGDNLNLAINIEGAGGTKNIQLYEFNGEDFQKFKFERENNTDGEYTDCYRIVSKVEKKENYMDVDTHSTNGYVVGLYSIKEYGSTDRYGITKDIRNQLFILEPQETETAEPDYSNKFKVEARVIFGDYNDDDDHRYQGLAEQLNISLHYRGNPDGNYGDSVHPGQVEKVKTARKDWCYQYNYTWNGLPTRREPDSVKPGYYVQLDGTHNGEIEIDGKRYHVYYVEAETFGTISQNTHGYANGDDDGRVMYPEDASHAYLNREGIIYIFLDPLNDWSWNSDTHPNTFNLTMKKRWDGYNEGNDVYKNRPKEKIQIQLQKWDNGSWDKCTSDNMNNYYNWMYYTDESGLFASSDGVTISNNVAADKRLKISNNGDLIEYRDQQGRYIDETTITEYGNSNAIASGKRLKLYLNMDLCNDVILSYDSKSNPQHFSIGYYYGWNDIPYGQYRVVETRSFYDVDDNNKYDENVDRDTSSEYYYMSFPPSRDSKGILHLQNFTKNMTLEVQKEWYDEYGMPDDSNSAEISFELYRTTTKAKGSVPSGLVKVGDYTTSGRYKKIENLDAADSSQNKYYYYIKETGIDEASYELVNGAGGFVRNCDGLYGTDYEDGDGRRFVIQNKKIHQNASIKIVKEWYSDEQAQNQLNYYGIKPTFEIYRSHYNGLPKYLSDNQCQIDVNPVINGVDTTGELVWRGTLLNNNTYEFSDENEIFEFYEDKLSYDNVVSYFNANGDADYSNAEIKPPFELKSNDLVNSPFVLNKNVKLNKANESIKLSSSIYINPKYDGVLRVELAEDINLSFVDAFEFSKRIGSQYDHDDSSKRKYFTLNENQNINQSEKFDGMDYSYDGSTRILEINLKAGAEYRFVRDVRNGRNSNNNPCIKNAVYTSKAYYYVRETEGYSYKLLKLYTYSDGFVENAQQTENNYFCTRVTSANNKAVVTARNMPVMKLDITKQWFQNDRGTIPISAEKMDNDYSCRFELYKSSENMEVPDINNLTLVKVPYDSTNNYFELPESGGAYIENMPAFDDNGEKLYYYIREVPDSSYSLLNDDVNGFIRSKDYRNYGVSFDMSDASHQYLFRNKPEFKLTVKKEWQNKEGQMDQQNKPEMKFMLLRSSEDYSRYFGSDNTLEVIKEGNVYKVKNSYNTENQTYEKSFIYVSATEASDGIFTTSSYELSFDSKDTKLSNFSAYNAPKTSSPFKVYYYVLEVDDDGANGYKVSDYAVSVSGQPASWSKYYQNTNNQPPVIKVINRDNTQEAFVMPSTGGPGTSGYKFAGAVVSTASLLLLIMSIHRKKR